MRERHCDGREDAPLVCVTTMLLTGMHLLLESYRPSPLARARYKAECTPPPFPDFPQSSPVVSQSFAMKFASSFVATVLLAASSLVGAVPISSQEIERKSAGGLSLLRLGPDVDPVWKTEGEKWELKKAGANFMDVTGTWTRMQSNPALKRGSKKVSTKVTCTLCSIGCGTGGWPHIS